MKFLEILDQRMIIAELESKGKEGVLRELVRVIAHCEKEVDEQKTLEILLERESLGSTGIGEGVAIPHGKSKDVKGFWPLLGGALRLNSSPWITNPPIFFSADRPREFCRSPSQGFGPHIPIDERSIISQKPNGGEIGR